MEVWPDIWARKATRSGEKDEDVLIAVGIIFRQHALECLSVERFDWELHSCWTLWIPLRLEELRQATTNVVVYKFFYHMRIDRGAFHNGRLKLEDRIVGLVRVKDA